MDSLPKIWLPGIISGFVLALMQIAIFIIHPVFAVTLLLSLLTYLFVPALTAFLVAYMTHDRANGKWAGTLTGISCSMIIFMGFLMTNNLRAVLPYSTTPLTYYMAQGATIVMFIIFCLFGTIISSICAGQGYAQHLRKTQMPKTESQMMEIVQKQVHQ